MPKSVSALELPLRPKPAGMALADWLSSELTDAIHSGRLQPGARLPATRDFAGQYNISRGTVLAVFEQLRSEGLVVTRVGAGTWVAKTVLEGPSVRRTATSRPDRTAGGAPLIVRPFRPYEPAVEAFPVHIWSRLTTRRWQRISRELLQSGHLGGYWPLRRAIAAYLGEARGVRCNPHQIVIVTGTQQALDLLARVTIRPGDAAWIEDPGYHGAVAVFRNAGARIVPVPVDAEGMQVTKGKRLAPGARVAYVTPAHQFPLGMTMSMARRLALLAWARATSAWIVEDDYDAEYRFAGQPLPSLQSIDHHGRVVLLGSFNKVLFSSLRLGYMVLPPPLVDDVLRLRYLTDRGVASVPQAILADFIDDGHFARHLRRTRQLYAERLSALRATARRLLGDALRIPEIDAGLATPAFYEGAVPSTRIEAAAAARGVEALALDRFVSSDTSLRGVLLGFAAFDPPAISRGMQTLATVLEEVGRHRRRSGRRPRVRNSASHAVRMG